MKDRFKFRVWEVDENQYRTKENNKCNVDFLLNTRNGKIQVGEGFEVYGDDADDIILEQCTGIKDKNGKLIYEGDVIKVTEFWEDGILYEKSERIESVCFGGGDCDCCFTVLHDGHYKLLCNEIDRASSITEVEVIGNIHENPELLGDK